MAAGGRDDHVDGSIGLRIQRKQAADQAPHGLDGDWPEWLADQAQRVEEALAHLSRTLAPGDAAAVLLYEIFGFSHAELGSLAGRSEEASRQHLHRLLRLLRSTPPAGPGPDEEAEDDDATYLYALCRYALAQRDPGGLVAVLRACRPQMMAVLANAAPGAWKDVGASRTRPIHIQNLLTWVARTEESVLCALY
jgi:RNA polymerase sigma-70 factor (ECF subfamily)